ncbi:MAG: hypothetical protein WC143_08490 [Eubacteriales bacterium]|jgi:hypothetical protein|nr:hypothetical protein [Clostridia bacterium]
MKIAIKSYGEELKWIDSTEIEINGKTLSTVLADYETKMSNALNENKKLKEDIELRITNFIKAFKGV